MLRISIFILFAQISQVLFAQTASVLVETESFEQKGGWVVDQQFIPAMGSPYLLAHGMGEPVENAKTSVRFPESGQYYFWVRTKDWVPDRPETPGTFKVIFNGEEFDQTFGVNKSWQWVPAGKIEVGQTQILEIELKDETGFEGRCDAIYFSKNKSDHPPAGLGAMVQWRKEKLG